jgi:hypothetical protein
MEKYFEFDLSMGRGLKALVSLNAANNALAELLQI